MVNKLFSFMESKCSDDMSLLDRIVLWDRTVSRRLALCSSPESRWGYLRPYMRMLEYSCHGVPWFVGVALLLLMSHQFEMQQRLLNLFSSEYDVCCSMYYYVALHNIKSLAGKLHGIACLRRLQCSASVATYFRHCCCYDEAVSSNWEPLHISNLILSMVTTVL